MAKSDIERRFGVSAGNGTAVNTAFSGLIALVLTTIFFAAVHFMPDNYFRAMLLERGPTQHATVFLGFWCIVILLFKRSKLSLQRRALRHAVIPENHEFVLTSHTADHVIRNIHALADDPARFLVYNRILIALSNLKNLGRVSDVDDILRANADRDESAHQTSFATLGGFLWAIPVLGFIGTVLGLAGAIGNFSSLLEKQSDVAGIVGSLKEVTGGLSTAFETTLLALVVALVIQLWITSQRKAEEMFLDDCQDYCLKQIVSRIKILPFEQIREI
ncbi:MotA/TolQ/ExbB proton channel family protein [Novipirellula sp.]|uniref:MotA/TolQ/ExbB proton channel family protein n=1 Tax=Novipirellula sp. TaxID=2795430 RepID=UPI003566B6E6